MRGYCTLVPLSAFVVLSHLSQRERQEVLAFNKKYKDRHSGLSRCAC